MQTTATVARLRQSSTADKAPVPVQQDFQWMPAVTVSAAATLVPRVPEVLPTSAQDASPTPSSATALVSVTVDSTWTATETVRTATTLVMLAHQDSTLDAQVAKPTQPSATVNVSVTVDSLWTATATVCRSTATRHVTDVQDLTPTTVSAVTPM